jgi:L-fuculose-phosphate aldolase
MEMQMRTARAAREDLLEFGRRQMAQYLQGGDWDTPTSIALTCRILFENGHDSGLAGQITARAEDFGSYWTQALGLGFDEITRGNLLRVNADLEVQEGNGMANPPEFDTNCRKCLICLWQVVEIATTAGAVGCLGWVF